MGGKISEKCKITNWKRIKEFETLDSKWLDFGYNYPLKFWQTTFPVSFQTE